MKELIDRTYGSMCMRSFEWWFAEDAIPENRKEEERFGILDGMVRKYLKKFTDYKCGDKTCGFCQV